MPNNEKTVSTEPTVKLTATFTVGEIVQHMGSKTDHKILSITPTGHLRLEGLCGLIEPHILRKK